MKPGVRGSFAGILVVGDCFARIVLICCRCCCQVRLLEIAVEVHLVACSEDAYAAEKV
jgi:hypothetical protein